MSRPRLFISHSWKDKFIVNKLAEQLTAHGVDVWVDEAELKVGDSLIQSISRAIQERDYFAIIISHSSVSSEWVQRELQLAMNLVLEKKKRRILPILIERCEIPLFLRDLLYADLTDPLKFDSALMGLLKSLGISVNTSVVPVKSSASPTPSATPSADGLSGFVDITIVEVDKSRSYKPDANMGLFNVYLKLSSVPPTEWAEIFDAERDFPRHSMWRRAWIEDECIVIHCVPEEMKRYHLRDLKEDVTNSNRKYRVHLMTREQQGIRESQREGKEKTQLDDALDGLDL